MAFVVWSSWDYSCLFPIWWCNGIIELLFCWYVVDLYMLGSTSNSIVKNQNVLLGSTSFLAMNHTASCYSWRSTSLLRNIFTTNQYIHSLGSTSLQTYSIQKLNGQYKTNNTLCLVLSNIDSTILWITRLRRKLRFRRSPTQGVPLW